MEIKIAIDNIELTSFELKPRLRPITNEQFHINLSSQVTVLQPPSNLALSITNIIVRELDGIEEFAKLSVLIAFRVENYDEVFPLENGIRTVPVGVNKLISSISISTTRGILFSQLKGTYLHKAIIPVIDMNSLRPEVVPPPPQEQKEAGVE